jgi:hypothetical protein
MNKKEQTNYRAANMSAPENSSAEHRELINENEQLRAEIKASQVRYAQLQAEVQGDLKNLDSKSTGGVLLNEILQHTDLDEVLTQLRSTFELLGHSEDRILTMTNAQRSRLQGAGVRRYGFIDKVSDLVQENPEFLPGFISKNDIEGLIHQIEQLRNIMATAQQILRVATDYYLLSSDEAYRLSRLYYLSVRDAAHNGILGAKSIFEMLRPLFHKTRTQREEPTEHQLERDVHALLHGPNDGEIVIENQSAHTTDGKRVVVDTAHKRNAQGEWKETEEG